MFEIFEQPWTLLGLAIIVLFGILTFRSFCPEKRHFWQLLIPIFIAAAAFGADMLVKTDLEKIESVISDAVEAFQQEDYRAIGATITNNYSDSYHTTKQHLLDHCKRQLSKSLIDKIKKPSPYIENISDSKATVILFTVLIFDKNSYISQNYKSFLMVRSRLSLRKQSDKNWLISRIELLEIDRQPTSWDRIR